MAGPLPRPVKIIGGGAGAYGFEAVREGQWFDEGALAAEIAICAPVAR